MSQDPQSMGEMGEKRPNGRAPCTTDTLLHTISLSSGLWTLLFFLPPLLPPGQPPVLQPRAKATGLTGPQLCPRQGKAWSVRLLSLDKCWPVRD